MKCVGVDCFDKTKYLHYADVNVMNVTCSVLTSPGPKTQAWCVIVQVLLLLFCSTVLLRLCMKVLRMVPCDKITCMSVCVMVGT